MRHAARFAMLLGALASVAVFSTALAPAAQAAEFGVAKFEAGTCNGNETEVKSCEYTSPNSAFYTQAAGHPPWGLTGVELAHEGTGSGRRLYGKPLKRIRVDVPPGLAADPQTLEACSRTEFKDKACGPKTDAGFVELEAVVGLPTGKTILTLKGKIFNLEQEANLPLLFGIEVEGVPPLVEDVQLFLEGHVSYAKEAALAARGVPSGDFHEWFEINEIPHTVAIKVLTLEESVPLETLKSKLFFNGRAGHGNFLTLPSACGAPAVSTSYVEVESDTGEIGEVPTVPPVGIEGCGSLVPPFEPITEVIPGPGTSEKTSDQPDGAITKVTVPQHEGAEEINTADISEAHATFPEGLTLNPSAAHGLEACPPAMIHFESTTQAECPAGSNIGKIEIETDLPPGSLAGSLYLGAPNGVPITGPPYTVYAVAESTYGVVVKVEGTVQPDPTTGRLTAYFKNTAAHPFNLPQLPFSSVVLELNSGPRAPLANPLGCGGAKTESNFIAYSGEGILKQFTPSFAFPTTGCPNPIPFVLAQSASPANTTAGAYSSYTFNLTRADGQQYLSQVSTTLPAGLLGAIPSVTLCGEPQAAAGTCSAASQIGVASVTAGAGTEPFPLSGPVYLTGPYDGAPYGLSIPVPVVAGPFNLGTVTTRATIKVNPSTARVTVATTNLPTIVGGVPVRLKTLKVEVNRPSFIFNPTNCSALATESTLTSTFNATQSISSPFQVGGCSALPFKPVFKVSTSAKTSKKNGASLQVSLTQPAHEANMKSVFVSLPKQLPSRLTTLQKACPEGTFAANPVNCRKLGSEVGSAVVTTPVLPGQLKGSAYLVSHGGEAFPDLDIVLEGDGITVVLTGNTKITKGVTSSTFATIPDVPVSSFVLTLPVGEHSALTSNGSLCSKALTVPTTIDAQSGAQLSQKTKLAVTNCPVQIVSHKVVGHKLVLKVKTFAAGRVSLKGKNLKAPRYKKLAKAKTATFTIPLSRKGLAALARHRKLKIEVRIGFVPKTKTEAVSSASVAVKFK
jgi:hypothetical protein